MPSLYIITGPAGVGKTTISTKLAKSLTKSVLIEGDSIYAQVIGSYVSAWKEGNHLEVFWKVCLNIIETYLSYGYDVVFNYIVTPSALKQIQEKFANVETKFVLLMTDEETLLKRDSFRPEDCQMKERCLVLLNNFKEKNFDSNFILDTSSLSVEDTVNIIQNDNRFLIRRKLCIGIK